MAAFTLACLSRLSLVLWAVALISWWVLPENAVTVMTGLAIAGTLAATADARRDRAVRVLLRALADAGVSPRPDPQPRRLRRAS